MIFGKNHFQYPNVLFYHGSDFTFGRFTLGITCLRRRFGQNVRGPPKNHNYSKALETFAHWFTLVPSLHQKYENWENKGFFD